MSDKRHSIDDADTTDDSGNHWLDPDAWPADTLTRADGDTPPTVLHRLSHGKLDDSVDEEILAPALKRTHIGRYELKELLGRGGIGAVYRARDPELGRDVAIKVLLAGAHAGSTAHRRFLREARAIARLDHPGIVRVHDFGVAGGEAYFTMQLVDGPPLNRVLAERGAFDPREAARIALELARTLSYAHGEGLLHRDVKPHNVLMEGGTSPLLTDFGLVKQLQGEESALLTQAGQIMGTPHYMAPEQALGRTGDLGPAVDQYAVGAMLYEMLSGQRPYNGLPAFKVLAEAQRSRPRSLRALAPSTPPDLIHVCERAMSRHPAERYGDMGQFADALRGFLDGDSVVSRRSLLGHRAQAWLHHNQGYLLRAAALLLTAALTYTLNSAWQEYLHERAESARLVGAESRRVGMMRRVERLDAAGASAQGDALFTSFVEFEDNQRNPTLSRAWMFQAKRLMERGEEARGKEAFATAYAQASSFEAQFQALHELAELFHQEGDWHSLRAVLTTLRARYPDARVKRNLTRDMALFDRDHAAARAAAGSQLKLVRAITQGTPTRWRAHAASTWRVAPDGRPELLLWRQGHPELQIVSTADAALPPVQTLTKPDDWAWGFPLPSPTPTLIYARTEGADSAVAALDGDRRWVPRGRFPDPWVWSPPHAVDLDGDGAASIYYGGNRGLYRLARGADGAWRRSAPHPPTNQTNSEVRQLIAADVDRDGADELLAATADWGAYDVRVFEAGEAPGALRLASRVKLGRVERVAAYRGPDGVRVAAYQSLDAYINRRVFDPEHAPLAKRGLHILGWGEEGLQRLGFAGTMDVELTFAERGQDRWEFLPPEHVAWFLEGADLDGDGLDELIFAKDPLYTVVLHQRADGTFTPMPLPGVYPLAVVQADDDPAAELLVTRVDEGSQVWVLGAGDTPLPPRARPSQPQPPPPRRIDPALQGAWERAEDLGSAGLFEAAAARLEQIAKLSVGTPTEPMALFRAAQLMERANRFERAGRHYQRAAASPRFRDDALEGARRSYQAAHLLKEELEVIEQMGAPTLTERADRLRRALEGESTTLTFDKGLDPRWRVLHPDGLRIDPRHAALHIRGAARRPAMELPLRPERETTLVLEVEFEPRRLDWAGVWSVQLAPPEDPKKDYWIRASGRGGGEAVFQSINCGHTRFLPVKSADHGEMLHHTITVRLEFDTEEGWGVCTIHRGEQLISRDIRAMTVPLPDGPLTLRVESGRDATTDVLLRRVRLTGVAPTDAQVTDPILKANHALTIGRPDQALRHLAGLPDSPAVVQGRAFALEELGRHEEASALFKAQVAQGQPAALRDHLTLNALERFEPLLRELHGDDYYPAVFSAWENTLAMHPNDDVTTETLTQHLKGLLELPLDAYADPDKALAHLELLIRCGAAWHELGRGAVAITYLDRAHALADHLLNSPLRDPDGLSERIGKLQAVAWYEQAQVWLAQRRPQMAFDALLKSLESAPSPTVFADIIAATPELAELTGHPNWGAIRKVQRGAWVPPAQD